MVTRANQCTPPAGARQGPREHIPEQVPEPDRVNANTPFDFEGKNLTAYGGLLPVATMLEKLGFEEIV